LGKSKSFGLVDISSMSTNPKDFDLPNALLNVLDSYAISHGDRGRPCSYLKALGTFVGNLEGNRGDR
jgi:hypothetical protein